LVSYQYTEVCCSFQTPDFLIKSVFWEAYRRVHQALFNNLFFLCKRYKYFNEAKEYFKKYENILDSRNVKSYNYNIKENNFTFKDRDIVGLVKKIDNYQIIIDTQEYKNYRFDVEVGDRVIFDLDYSHNIRNIEKLD
jgi:hypothetical protein